MLFRIDPLSRQPIFEQVAASVRRELSEGELAVGDRLPPAKEVAGALQVNLHTILRAYQLLRDEGLVDLRRGRGAVVVGTNPTALAGLRDAVHALVSAAAAAGMPQAEVIRLIKEESI